MQWFVLLLQYNIRANRKNNKSSIMSNSWRRCSRKSRYCQKEKDREKQNEMHSWKCGQTGESDTAICRNNYFRTSKLVGYKSSNSHAECSVTLRLPALRAAVCWVRSTIDVSGITDKAKKEERTHNLCCAVCSAAWARLCLAESFVSARVVGEHVNFKLGEGIHPEPKSCAACGAACERTSAKI